MSDFLGRMKAAAKADKKTIVLPEGEDPRTIEAAKKIVEEDLANLVILGNPDEIDVPGATVIDPRNAEKHEEYASKFAELRAKKGVTIEQARAQVMDATYFGTMMVKMGDADGLVSGACHSTADTLRPAKHEEYAQKFAELRAKKGVTIEQARAQVMDATYFGTMMVKMGDADGLVSGACHSTADTLRPALQILKTAPGTRLVSAFMIMCTKTPEFGADGTLVFADCGLNIAPTSDELSEIAIASANSFKTFMGDIEPKVAMLSYSTMGSAGGDTAKKVQEATAFAKEKAPELAIDGDLQLDAAIVPSVAELKAPESKVAGHANVLVFPNLETGNIGYKLVQRFGGAEAYGPILQGIAKPVNDLSRGCSADDIVGVVAITAVQAQMAEQGRRPRQRPGLPQPRDRQHRLQAGPALRRRRGLRPDPAGHRQAGERPVPRLLRRRHCGRRGHHGRLGADGRVAQPPHMQSLPGAPSNSPGFFLRQARRRAPKRKKERPPSGSRSLQIPRRSLKEPRVFLVPSPETST